MEKSSAAVGSTYVDYPASDHSTMYSSMRSLDYVGSMPQNIYHSGKHYGALDFTSAGAQSQTNCFSHLTDSHHTSQRLHDFSSSGCTTLNYMYGGAGYPYASEANHYAQHPGNSESPDYPSQRHSRSSPTPSSHAHYNGSYASESATVLNANSATGATTGPEQHSGDSRPVSNGDAGDRHTASSPGSEHPAGPGETGGLYKWMRIKRNPPKTGNYFISSCCNLITNHHAM